MGKKLDPEIATVLKGYGYGPDACWDCHGTWVVYHKVLERIAAQAGIEFDAPTIIEANGAAGVAAVCVTGRLNDAAVWSIGEASPKNSKNAYPWAMAEKRAIDRVILKLIGLHGLAYSEEEADDFVPPQANGSTELSEDDKRARAAAQQQARKIERDTYMALAKTAIANASTVQELRDWWRDEAPRRREYGLSKEDEAGLVEIVNTHKAALEQVANLQAG